MQLNRTSVLVAPVMIALLFASTLLGIDRLAFRDVSHFYTPLYDYLAARTSSQWLPLWNPLDQTGVPLVGESTTAVFYPLRYLLFSLPISSEIAIAWYVALHLLIASLAARTCARWCGATRLSAAIAGIIYPLSGSVLFLHTNPPFLVGAAWLPLVLGSIISRRRMVLWRRVLIAGAALALMVLGGDPQTGIHAMLVAGVVALFRLRQPSHVRRHEMLFVLVAVPLLAMALAAPQIAASLSWSRQSDRIAHKDDGYWLDPPRTDSRRYEAFQFSLPPWHTLELATPNAFGSHLPRSHRLSTLIPGDGRMWTPSIYLSMLAAIALLSRIVCWRRTRFDVWLGIAMASLILSLGHFGAVWVIQSTGMIADCDSAVGGLYWMLYHFLPGYDAFRYPAKWLPLFSLAVAMVTAAWLDRGIWREVHVMRRVTITLLSMLTIASVVVLFLRWNPTILVGDANAITGLPVDPLWGPLDIAAGLAEVQISLLHSVIVLAVIILVLRSVKRVSKSDPENRNVAARQARRPSFAASFAHLPFRLNRQGAKCCLLVVVGMDLAISGCVLISKIPIEQERELIAALPKNPTIKHRWMRTQSEGGWPKIWQQSRDRDRLLDVETSARHAWFGRWHLAERQSVFNNMMSIQSNKMTMFWQTAGQVSRDMNLAERDEFWNSLRHWLAIDGVVHTTSQSTDIRHDGRLARLVDVQHSHLETPSFRFHGNWRGVSKSDASVDSVKHLLGEIHSHRESVMPRVEFGNHETLPAAVTDTLRSDQEIRVIVDQAELAEIELKSEIAGLLIRPTFQDGNWQAAITPAQSQDWQPLTVRSVDYLKQGVLLPAGHWKVRFNYAPIWMNWSIVTAVCSWFILMATFIRLRRGRPASNQLAPIPAKNVSL